MGPCTTGLGSPAGLAPVPAVAPTPVAATSATAAAPTTTRVLMLIRASSIRPGLRRRAGRSCPARSGEGGDPGEGAADEQLLHLRRAFVERGDSRVAQQLAHDELVDVAVSAVHLYGG